MSDTVADVTLFSASLDQGNGRNEVILWSYCALSGPSPIASERCWGLSPGQIITPGLPVKRTVLPLA